MTKRDKIIIAALSVLVLVFSVFMLTAASVHEANMQAVEDFRERTLRTFGENTVLYEDTASLVKSSFVYDEICIIFNENGAFVKNDYSNVSISNDALRQELLSFAEKTDVDVIYYDGEQTFFKTAFSVGEEGIEANLIIRDDGEKPEYENCRKLSGDWYYTELEIS